MDPFSAIQALVAIGAVAILLLMATWRLAPPFVGAAIATIAIAAAYATLPILVSWGLALLPQLLMTRVMGYPEESAGMLSMVIFGPATIIAQPIDILSGKFPWARHSWLMSGDAVYWSLLQMLAISAILSRTRRPMFLIAHRPTLSETPWAGGYRAAITTMFTAILLNASWLGSNVLPPTIYYLREVIPLLVAAAIFALRWHRPLWMSWGAWILAVGAFVQAAWQLLTRLIWIVFDDPDLIRLEGNSWPYAALACVSAIILMGGPAGPSARHRFGWLICAVIVVLPGFGHLCLWISQSP
jgi:hypothetical protein